MKFTTLIALCVCNILCTAQNVTIESNVDSAFREQSYVLNNLEETFDILIAYSEGSYWRRDRIHYQIFARKAGAWFLITLSSHERREGRWTSPKIKKKRLPDETAEQLLQSWDEIHFLSLNSDSLNIQSIQRNDSSNSEFIITAIYNHGDGVNYKFEIITQNNYRVIQAYEPEYFLQKIPEISIRQTFIAGKNIFKSILAEIGS